MINISKILAGWFFPFMNALVYADIDQGIHKGTNLTSFMDALNATAFNYLNY